MATTIGRPWRRATSSDEGVQDRMNDIDLGDELSRLKKFAACLAAAIKGAETFHKGEEREGVYWLASDVASDISALAEAFDKERHLRQIERSMSSRHRPSASCRKTWGDRDL